MTKRATGLNTRLQRAIAATGCSFDRVARLVREVAVENGDVDLRTNKSAIAHWIAGTRPNDRTIDYLVEALSRLLPYPVTAEDLGLSSAETATISVLRLPDDPVHALVRLGRADVDRRDVIRRSVYSISALLLPLQTIRAAVLGDEASAPQPSSRVGAAEVRAVIEMTAALTAADERLGGGHARTAVIEYLATDVATYLRGSYASEQIRKAMFGAAAQLAYLAGWKAHDLGLAGLAQRYYLHSYQLAGESDPFGHAAYGLRILAHQAMDLGRREHCVDLADAALALTKDRLDPGTRSLFYLTAARAHAANGNRRHAQAALTTAESLLGKADDDPPPTWASLGGSAEARLSHQAGKTLQALGEHAAAEHQLRRAAAAWSPRTHPRVHGLTLADLAETLCAQGKIELACATWQSALDSMSGVRSARTIDAVRSLRSHLAAYRRRNIAAVRALDARVRALELP